MNNPLRQERNKAIAKNTKRVATVDAIKSVVETSLDDDKAEDVVVIDLFGKSDVADYVVVATGSSQRKVGAMADHLQEKLKQSGCPRVNVEGRTTCDWVLIDAGDVIVHLFKPEVREFYRIEKIWSTPAPVQAQV